MNYLTSILIVAVPSIIIGIVISHLIESLVGPTDGIIREVIYVFSSMVGVCVTLITIFYLLFATRKWK